MATTRINHQQALVAGLNLVFTAVDLVNGSNYVPNPGRVLLLQNTSGAAVTVTLVTPQTRAGGLAIADDPVVVPATTTTAVSIQDPTDFISPAGQIDFTATAAINAAVVQA